MEARPKKKQFKCLLSSLYLAQFLTSIGHNRKTSHKMQGCIGLDGGSGGGHKLFVVCEFFSSDWFGCNHAISTSIELKQYFSFPFPLCRFRYFLVLFLFPIPFCCTPFAPLRTATIYFQTASVGTGRGMQPACTTFSFS